MCAQSCHPTSEAKSSCESKHLLHLLRLSIHYTQYYCNKLSTFNIQMKLLISNIGKYQMFLSVVTNCKIYNFMINPLRFFILLIIEGTQGTKHNSTTK